MACVVIWQLGRRQEPEANALRQVLIRLSGRQMKWGTAFTAPAVLAGVGVLMAMLDVLEQFGVAEIVKLTRRFLPGHDGMIL